MLYTLLGCIEYAGIECLSHGIGVPFGSSYASTGICSIPFACLLMPSQHSSLVAVRYVVSFPVSKTRETDYQLCDLSITHTCILHVQAFTIHVIISLQFFVSHSGQWSPRTRTCTTAINTDMNGRVCGALVQFGCYQHRHE